MTSVSTTHSSIWFYGSQQCQFPRKISEQSTWGHMRRSIPHKSSFRRRNYLMSSDHCSRAGHHRIICSSILDSNDPEEPEDESLKESSKPENEGVFRESFRDNLERTVGVDDSKFNGTDLATLIRSKYGRSYDVQLIKKEFMGKNFLAMNVMWKYREQRSFPLTEEEYILRLDDVANSLKCWGAVSHIRNSLEKLKERPRIGKAVSIFIDMDEFGARSNEWIYK
ncbi:hypothetical protein KSS87_019802 [Heliosperma pusillum]|nr:hypothetical protein KSS87_019802 [Heliosperma pusillum]